MWAGSILPALAPEAKSTLRGSCDDLQVKHQGIYATIRVVRRMGQSPPFNEADLHVGLNCPQIGEPSSIPLL